MEKVLTRNISPGKAPTDMAAYEANGGYSALRKAMTGMSPDDCRQVISDSNLRGRGGAGFPTAVSYTHLRAHET